MAQNTFINASGGSWETAADWSLGHVPTATEDAFLTSAVAGTYTVTMSATEGPNSITINDPTATLSVASTGIVLGSPIALAAGTLALTGQDLGSTITVTGGAFAPAGGTLDGVTWMGPLIGAGSTAAYSVNIKDGITLLNTAGTGPGTLDIGSLYLVRVVDATPLNNMTISFDAVNNEYLYGSSSVALILGANVQTTQTQAGASASIYGAQLNNGGTITASANGGSFFVGSNTFDNSGVLTVTNGDHAYAQNAFSNTGTVVVSASGILSIVNGSATNTSTISVSSAGTLSVASDMTGAGRINLASFALADVHNLAGTVVFQDNKDTLRLESPGSFTASLGGFQAGDKIDLPGQTVTGFMPYSGTASGGTLTVLNGTTIVATLSLIGDYRAATFSYATDGGTGELITVACYAEGTRILTESGEVPVEQLHEGQRVVTLSGAGAALKPIRWIGTSRIDFTRHPNPESVRPIRIRAGAIGPDMPHRDLLVSPDHAILQGEHLVPARLLVNGATILREEGVAAATYFHVELDAHDILLADGVPAESYLDTGNRHSFAGAVQALHPVFADAADDRPGSCRALLTGGAMVEAAHAALLQRAAALGHVLTDDAALAIEADGVVLAIGGPARGRWVAELPAGTRRLRLRSRRAAFDTGVLVDGRPLGVAVSAVLIDGAALPLESAALAGGFHPLEREGAACWRWTDGDAELVLPAGTEAATLEIVGLVGWRSYWEADAAQAGLSKVA